MNSYERVMEMVRGGKPDLVPRIPILMHFAARHIGASYADFAGDHTVMAEANKRLVRDFGFDQLDVMSDPYRETAAFGGTIEYRESTVPRCSPPLEGTKDLASLRKPDPHTSDRMSGTIGAIRLYKEFGWQRYSITGWVEGPAAEAANLRGISQFMLDLIDDEVFVTELMELCTDVAIEYALAQIAEGADTIGVGDAIASQISPAMYERLVEPRERRLIQAIRRAGGLARLHICGDISRHLVAIKRLEADIVDCDWMVDMESARRILGPHVTLTGNIDPVAAVAESAPEAIRKKLREIYERVGRPYFVNAGCEIPAHTPPENLKALCEPIPAT